MKKIVLSVGLSVLIGGSSLFAQRAINKTNRLKEEIPTAPAHRICGTPVIDDPRFEEWMANGIAELQASGALNQRSTYTIPVIIHIIHNGGAVGTTYNISAARCSSQIDVLNKDYSATNTDISNVPPTFQSVEAGDIGVQFCMATKDPNGNTLTEPGIHRVNISSISGVTWSNSGLTQSDINTKIKPATIWDVTKYLNIWVVPISGGILGYATFPAGTGLSGLSGFGTTTTDGVVIGTSYFGTGAGTSAPFNKGRTATHEVGHWLGLRHIWGDSNCGNDYVSDTPTQPDANYGCPTHPLSNSCTSTPQMFMNYMDYVDDACMYMFTAGQKSRIIQAMTNGTYRKTLNASSSTNCGSSAPSAPVADFSANTTTITTGGTVSFTDLSSNSPTTWTWTASPAAGVSFSNPNAKNPTATFANVGQYTISLTASNAQGSNTATKANYITVIDASSAPCDTITNISQTDTLVIYGPHLGQTATGYVSGNNSYGDAAKAEYFNASALNGRQVTGAVILFYRNSSKNLGTKAGANGNSNGTITVQMLNKTTNGSPGTTVLATQNVTLQSIVQTTPVSNVQYVGNPSIGYTTPIIYPYKVTFSSPVNITGDFFINVVLPTTSGDTAVIFQNTIDNTNGYNTAWEKSGGNQWYPFDDANNSWGISASLAILPTTCPLSTGFNSTSTVASNNIIIYPNPNNGHFKILTTLGEQTTEVTITDLVGRVITSHKEKTGNNYMQFDLSNQPNGIYFVTVQSGTEKVTHRINLIK